MNKIFNKAFGIVTVYFLIGCLWILFTDRIIGNFISDIHLLTKYQTYKGWFYILSTTILLYLLIVSHLRKTYKSNQQLEESNQLKSRLLSGFNLAQQTAEIGSWEWDMLTGKIWWSDELYKIHEVEADKFIPEREAIAAFIHPDDRITYLKNIENAILNKNTLNSDIRIISGKGTLKYCNSIGIPVFDSEGKPVFMSGTIMDITFRKQAELALRDSETRYRSFFENSMDAILLTSPDGGIISANPAACEMFGYTESELISLGRSGVVDKEDHRLHALVQMRERENKVRGELTFIRKNGDKFIAEFSSTIFMSSSGAPNTSLIIRDITERRKAEMEIRTLNNDLELRVVERTRQLQEANNELEAFSFSVSHDLRAPLRGIDGFTGILLDDYSPQLDEEGIRICNIIRDNTRRMGQLIDDLLAFSRLGRSELNNSWIDMNTLVHSVYNEITENQANEKIVFSVSKLSKSYGDPNLIRQVWVNLLSNAIKYSSKKEKSIINVSCKSEKDMCVFAVNDNGAGFDMEYYDKLFGVFQRLHSTRDFEGNGVGLASVQRIVKRHGGEVWAEGKEGEGATFFFSLPDVNFNPNSAFEIA